jgi:hypothetical protein
VQLPDYFLADIPDPTALSPAVLTDACLALKSNRRRFLANRTTADLIDVVARLAEDWMDSDNPFRREALEFGPAATGFSPETIAAGLDAFFESLTGENLRQLVLQDLGHPHRLERLTAGENEPGRERLGFARGPELLVHIAGGVLPNPPLVSLVLGLLTRSAQLVKCASGTSFLPRLFAHSLYEIEPKLGACLEIAEWKGGTSALESVLFAQADCISAMGEDATLTAIRERLPPGTRFLGYGSRVSFGYVAQEALSKYAAPRLAAAAAEDVAAWNQMGCLSPHVFYVENGGTVTPERFAEMLASGLAAREQFQPRGPLPAPAAAAISSRRAFYEVRAAHSNETQLWSSFGSTDWTVVFESDPRFQFSCLNRFVYVKPVANINEALQGADAIRGKVSTVGLAASGTNEQALAQCLAQWGVTRICPLGRMQRPPLAWRHDGRPSLGDLVTWTDWELPSRW